MIRSQDSNSREKVYCTNTMNIQMLNL
ncbi:hypothetical protein LCGC14_1222100, partial [marine sediment metagenome]